MQGYGLSRVQYSGFVGELDPHDHMVLVGETKRFVAGERDSIYVVPLCGRCEKLCRIITLSRGEQTLEEASRVVYIE